MQLGHAKVSHLGSATDQEDVVAAEVAVQHLVAMEVGESLCHVVAPARGEGEEDLLVAPGS